MFTSSSNDVENVRYEHKTTEREVLQVPCPIVIGFQFHLCNRFRGKMERTPWEESLQVPGINTRTVDQALMRIFADNGRETDPKFSSVMDNK